MRIIRSTAAALATAMLLSLSAPAGSEAGEYVVRQCEAANWSHEGVVSQLPNPGPWTVRSGCAAGSDHAIRIDASGASLDGQHATTAFTAPPGTKIVRVEVEAKLRREGGHKSRLFMADGSGASEGTFARGPADATGFTTYSWPSRTGRSATGHQQFAATLLCESRHGNVCPYDSQDFKGKTYIRKIEMTVRDTTPPRVTLDGGAVGGGWLRGGADLQAGVADSESGVHIATTTVNGELTGQARIANCERIIARTTSARTFNPCNEALTESVALDTRSSPFHDGKNRIEVCGFDYLSFFNGSFACTGADLMVDNTPPTLAFTNAQDSNDPELLSVSAKDETSGLSPGTASLEYRRVGTDSWIPLATTVAGDRITSRVDSTSRPPGSYEFRVSIADRAGNVSETSKKLSGEPMVLTFPLKQEVELASSLGQGRAQRLVRYRKEGEVVGRLVAEDGRPVSGAPVEVVESFDPGSLIDENVRSTVTDAGGHYEMPLNGGPSREVDVRFPGNKRYLPARSERLDFDVLGKAKLRTSRRRVKEGRKLVFRGRVKRHFAAIPPKGKQVEIQVKGAKGWSTIKQATGTDDKGRLKLRYRFGNFYNRRVAFKFRLKVTNEAGWPYGSVTTRRKKVTVVPR